MHSNVNKDPKIQILVCIDDIYTHTLKEKYTAYRKLSCFEVITHLKNNYYKINPASLKENAAHMIST